MAGLFVFWTNSGARVPEGLRLSPNRGKFALMDGTQAAAIHQALVAVQHAVTSMTFPSCDQEDLIEAIDQIEEQLHTTHPNLALMCRFLNSVARSLRHATPAWRSRTRSARPECPAPGSRVSDHPDATHAARAAQGARPLRAP